MPPDLEAADRLIPADVRKRLTRLERVAVCLDYTDRWRSGMTNPDVAVGRQQLTDAYTAIKSVQPGCLGSGDDSEADALLRKGLAVSDPTLRAGYFAAAQEARDTHRSIPESVVTRAKAILTHMTPEQPKRVEYYRHPDGSVNTTPPVGTWVKSDGGEMILAKVLSPGRKW